MGFFVYKYVYNDEIIYIGKSDASLKKRIRQHAKEEKFQPYTDANIYYIKLANSAETKAVESFLINKYKPFLNIVDKYNSKSNFLNFDEPDWELYEEKIFKYSDKAFAVACGLKLIMDFERNINIYVTYNRIAHELLRRKPTRSEYEAIKDGFKELENKNYIKIVDRFMTTEFIVDVSNLQQSNEELFYLLTPEEIHKIMNVNGNYDKYKMLRYFSYQIKSFYKSKNTIYCGKVGNSCYSDYEEWMNIDHSTVSSFNKLLEENKILFIARYSDYFGKNVKLKNGITSETNNIYSRWVDKELAIKLAYEKYTC